MAAWVSAHTLGNHDPDTAPALDHGGLLGLALGARPAWMDDAECARRGMDVTLFVQDGAGSDYAEARAACEACPVRADCLEEAMAGGSTVVGVWGGTTPGGRRRLRDERRARVA